MPRDNWCSIFCFVITWDTTDILVLFSPKPLAILQKSCSTLRCAILSHAKPDKTCNAITKSRLESRANPIGHGEQRSGTQKRQRNFFTNALTASSQVRLTKQNMQPYANSQNSLTNIQQYSKRTAGQLEKGRSQKVSDLHLTKTSISFPSIWPEITSGAARNSP